MNIWDFLLSLHYKTNFKVMTKNELKEVQYFLENLDDPNPNEFLDSMGVIEAITTWLRNIHKEQGPKKLGVEFNEKL